MYICKWSKLFFLPKVLLQMWTELNRRRWWHRRFHCGENVWLKICSYLKIYYSSSWMYRIPGKFKISLSQLLSQVSLQVRNPSIGCFSQITDYRTKMLQTRHKFTAGDIWTHLAKGLEQHLGSKENTDKKINLCSRENTTVPSLHHSLSLSGSQRFSCGWLFLGSQFVQWNIVQENITRP